MKRPELLLISLVLLICVPLLPALDQEAKERKVSREELQRQNPDGEGSQEDLTYGRIKNRGLQVRPNAQQTPKLKVIYLTPDKTNKQHESLASLKSQSAAGTTIPMWSYSTGGYDGNTYEGAMVGRSPFFHGARTTNIPTIIIPIIFNIAGTVFDPTAEDTACGLPASAVTLIQQSPLLSNISQSINSVNVGTGQYTDLFQRSNFWADVSNTANSYHTVLSPVTVLAAQILSPTSADAIVDSATSTGFCGPLGIISNTWFQNQLETVTIPNLASSGVNPTVFPIFLLYNVVQSSDTPPDITNCCILGYHGSFGTPMQTYSPLDFDGLGAFGAGYTSTMSHEIGEWMDDPNGSNLVPAWGAEGQQSGCQNNLEVGDPLSPGFSTPTKEFSLAMPNGLTYDMQELAYYSWFYGATSLGAGGDYSDNGTFKGFAKACPPGGTN